jgi:sec-independent protein translocase protein TatB
MGEIAVLVLLGLILFGPKRLPEIARQMGKFVAEFKRASNDFQAQIHQEINKLEIAESAKKLAEETKDAVGHPDDPDSITSALSRLTERIKSIPQDYDA